MNNTCTYFPNTSTFECLLRVAAYVNRFFTTLVGKRKEKGQLRLPDKVCFSFFNSFHPF